MRPTMQILSHRKMPNGNLIKGIDSKTITSAGGIVIAIMAFWILGQILTRDMSRVESAIRYQADVQAATNDVLRDNTAAIEGNTKVLEILEGRLR